MDAFSEMLSKKNPKELDGDVFDVLDSLGDFMVFKELILNYKNWKNGTALDISGLLSVTPQK